MLCARGVSQERSYCLFFSALPLSGATLEACRGCARRQRVATNGPRTQTTSQRPVMPPPPDVSTFVNCS